MPIDGFTTCLNAGYHVFALGADRCSICGFARSRCALPVSKPIDVQPEVKRRRRERVYPMRVDAKFCPACGEAKPERVGDHMRAVNKWKWRCRDCGTVFITTAEGGKRADPDDDQR